MLQTSSFQCQVLGKEEVCSTFNVIGITQPGIIIMSDTNVHRSLHSATETHNVKCYEPQNNTFFASQLVEFLNTT